MNLEKLFETQKELREKINYQGNDRFEKLVLALLVEIGECANEWRGFKFWSKNQHPRHIAITDDGRVIKNQKGTPPLLEEYVDGLCFILELGLEKNLRPELYLCAAELNPTDSFITVMELATKFEMEPTSRYYSLLFSRYEELGELLGFTKDEIEQAYYEKNRINHERQANGY